MLRRLNGLVECSCKVLQSVQTLIPRKGASTQTDRIVRPTFLFTKPSYMKNRVRSFIVAKSIRLNSKSKPPTERRICHVSSTGLPRSHS